MKKLATTGLLCMVVVFVGSTACAQEFSASVGIKAWYNKWEGYLTLEDVESEDESLLVGPSVKLSYKRFFGGVTYLLSTSDYDYHNNRTYDDPASGASAWAENDTSAGREDLDVLVGLMVHPRVGVFAGYKRIVSSDAHIDYRSGVEGVDSGTGQPIELGLTDLRDVELQLSGFAFGVTCNYPLPKLPIVLTANAAYMPNMRNRTYHVVTETETEDGAVTEESFGHGSVNYYQDGYTVELGATYTLGENIGLSLGYKYQEIEKDDNVGEFYDSADMEFSGVTFGIDYRF